MNTNVVLLEINEKLDSINKSLIKQTSFKRSFLLSVVNGVGTVVGASIVAGIVITVIYHFIFSLENTIPILKNIIPQNSISSIYK